VTGEKLVWVFIDGNIDNKANAETTEIKEMDGLTPYTVQQKGSGKVKPKTKYLTSKPRSLD